MNGHTETGFRKKIYSYYEESGRDLPWRKNPSPYHVVVSEIMLQQTQVNRVVEKYNEFVALFPSFEALARAPTDKLLRAWSGLGYNRRALALRSIAQDVVEKFNGELPSDPQELMQFKGIGPATAASIAAYTFNSPTVFIETNIRAVYIHCFFQDAADVSDDQILHLVEQTLDYDNPSRWYNALMDYGVMLKQKHGNPSRKSKHHVKQSRFEGSNRQVRGMILKSFNEKKEFSEAMLAKKIGKPLASVSSNLTQLSEEGFLTKKGKKYVLT